jgi:hypothetical protein
MLSVQRAMGMGMRQYSTIAAKAALAIGALLASLPLISAWAGGPASGTGFNAGTYGGGADGPATVAGTGSGGAGAPATVAGAGTGSGGADGPAAAAVNSGVGLLADGCSGGSGGAC